jgi:hypothetical protein
MSESVQKKADLIELETVGSFKSNCGASGEDMGCEADDPNKEINGPVFRVELRVMCGPI